MMMKVSIFLLVLIQVWSASAFAPKTQGKCSKLVLNYDSYGMTRYNGNRGGGYMNDYNDRGYGGSGGGYGRDRYYGARNGLNSQGAYSYDYTSFDGRMPAYNQNSYQNRYNQGGYNRRDMYDRDYNYGRMPRRSYGYGMNDNYDTNNAYGRSYGRGSYNDYGGYGRRSNGGYGGRGGYNDYGGYGRRSYGGYGGGMQSNYGYGGGMQSNYGYGGGMQSNYGYGGGMQSNYGMGTGVSRRRTNGYY